MNCIDESQFEQHCPQVNCRANGDCPFRAVIITPEMGSDEPGQPFAPKNGDYQNAIVKYEINGNAYIYSSDGIAIPMPNNGSISLNFDYLTNRPKYAGSDMTHATNIPDVNGAVLVEKNERIASYNALNAAKENVVSSGNTSQYYRGDKTWKTLDKNAVGLGNVDNTSDSAKKFNFAGLIVHGDTGFARGGDVKDALDLKADLTDVGHGVVTINNNGTSIGSFNVNQSSNTNISIDTLTAESTSVSNVRQMKDSTGAAFVPKVTKAAISDLPIVSADLAADSVTQDKIDHSSFEYNKSATVAPFTTVTSTETDVYSYTVLQDGLFNLEFSVNFANETAGSEVTGKCSIWKGDVGTGSTLSVTREMVNGWASGHYQTCKASCTVRLSAGDVVSASTKSFGGDLATSSTSMTVSRIL